MKFTIIALMLLLSINVGQAHKDRIEMAQVVSVTFKTGEKATFTFDEEILKAIDLDMGNWKTTIPKEIIARLSKIHLDTVVLLWNSSFTTAKDADYFNIRFSAGDVRHSGELPEINLNFQKRKFSGATITRQTKKGTWDTDAL